MGTKTGIEWTDSTWNPIRGCTPVSAGCKNCYAAAQASRFSHEGGPFEGLVRINAAGARTDEWNGAIRFVEKHLLDPLKWGPVVEHDADCRIAFVASHTSAFKPRKCDCPTRPRRIFVNSVSDLFHENVTDKMRDRIFAVMALCPQHIFQVLTKRPERMLKYFREKHRNPQGWPEEDYDVQTCIRLSFGGLLEGRTLPNGRPDVMSFFKSGRAERYGEADARVFSQWPLSNVWLGVSVENQKAADDRIDYLCELGSRGWQTMVSFEPLLGDVDPGSWWLSLGARTWAIVGGESGQDARPMHPDWARSLRDQCAVARVPFFFKQWGEWKPISEMPESEYGAFYVSNKKAPEEWQQVEFDDIYGKRCTVPIEYMNFGGETGINRGFQSIGGHGGMTFFRAGKKAAGSLLDGVTHKEFPAVRA